MSQIAADLRRHPGVNATRDPAITPATGLATTALIALFLVLPVSGVWPNRLLSLYPAVLLAGFSLLMTAREGMQSFRSWGFLPFFVVMSALAVASFIANPYNEWAMNCCFAGYPSGLVVYLAVRLRHTTHRDFNAAMLAFSASAMMTLVLATWQFLSTYGLPDINTLMLARFDESLEPYRLITWGNVTNTSSFLVQITPLLLVFALDKNSNSSRRIWYTSCVLICVANLLFINTRSAYIVLAVSIPILLYFTRSAASKPIVLGLLVLVVSVLFFLNSDDGQFWTYMQGVTSLDRADDSAYERLTSMRNGLGVLFEYPLLGVGAGNSQHHIPEFAAHQMALQHGVEFGLLGLFGNVILVVMVAGRTYMHSRRGSASVIDRQSFACCLSAFAYLLNGTIANSCVAMSVINCWIVTLAATLALADSRRDLIVQSQLTPRRSPVKVGGYTDSRSSKEVINGPGRAKRAQRAT